MKTPKEAPESRTPPAGGFGAASGKSLERRPVPVTRIPRSRVVLGCVVAVFVLAYAAWFALERRIEVIADSSTVIVKAVPGDDLRYRLSTNDAFAVAAGQDVAGAKNYIFRLPIPEEARPKRGKLPIQIDYRTWLGPRTKAWVSLDIDEEQLRYFFSSMWSGGWSYVARFEGDGRMSFGVSNERCIRWRYGLDGAAPRIDLEEGARELTVPVSVQSVVFEPVLCKLGHYSCKVTVFRDNRTPARDCGKF